MLNYKIKQLNNDQYYLICMDYNSVLNYLDEVENDPLIQFNAGSLIIDQLLVAGNGKNRFITCKFSYGEIRLDTAKNVDVTDTFKRISSEVFYQNLEVLQYSILTESQLDLIRQGQVV